MSIIKRGEIMFIFKFLTGTAVGLVLSASAYADPSIALRTLKGYHSLRITIEKDGALGQHLIDAITKSPSVNEVTNVYVPPKSLYQAPGMSLDLESPSRGAGYIELTLTATAEDETELIIQGNFLHLSGKSGVVRTLHEVLLNSKSAFVYSKNNPGRISAMTGEAFVLEKDTFVGANIGCRPSFNRPDISNCSFELKK